MPSPGRTRPIGKSRAIVQLRMIIDELHVAGPQLHGKMQFWIVGQRIEQIQRFHVPGR